MKMIYWSPMCTRGKIYHIRLSEGRTEFILSIPPEDKIANTTSELKNIIFAEEPTIKIQDNFLSCSSCRPSTFRSSKNSYGNGIGSSKSNGRWVAQPLREIMSLDKSSSFCS